MIVYEHMIACAAEEAGMRVPPDHLLDVEGEEPTWDREKYPHFLVFCQMQLNRKMSSSGQHWENAKIIAAIPDDEIRIVTQKQLEEKGVDF